jgi:hypothetical protein
MRVWDMDGTDIGRFEITRDQWEVLIQAIAGSAAWAKPDSSAVPWNALDVLRKAEDVIDTTAMQNALKQIRDCAKHDDGQWASTYLRLVDQALDETQVKLAA